MENISRSISTSPETQILNYIPINKNLATSGQPTPVQIEAIANANYTSLINLAMHNSTDALFEEGGLASEVGMNYFHIPVPFNAPTRQHLTLFLNLLHALEGQKIWIHCAYNWRASAFTRHYQTKVLGIPHEQIEMLVFKQWTPNSTWLTFFELD